MRKTFYYILIFIQLFMAIGSVLLGLIELNLPIVIITFLAAILSLIFGIYEARKRNTIGYVLLFLSLIFILLGGITMGFVLKKWN